LIKKGIRANGDSCGRARGRRISDYLKIIKNRKLWRGREKGDKAIGKKRER